MELPCSLGTSHSIQRPRFRCLPSHRTKGRPPRNQPPRRRQTAPHQSRPAFGPTSAARCHSAMQHHATTCSLSPCAYYSYKIGAYLHLSIGFVKEKLQVFLPLSSSECLTEAVREHETSGRREPKTRGSNWLPRAVLGPGNSTSVSRTQMNKLGFVASCPGAFVPLRVFVPFCRTSIGSGSSPWELPR